MHPRTLRGRKSRKSPPNKPKGRTHSQESPQAPKQPPSPPDAIVRFGALIAEDLEAMRRKAARSRPREDLARKAKLAAAQAARSRVSSEVTSGPQEGAGAGDKPSQARARVGARTWSDLSEANAIALHGWLEQNASVPGAKLELSRDQVQSLYQLLMWHQGTERRFSELTVRIAHAQRLFEHGTGHDATRARDALRCIFLDAPARGRKGRKFDETSVAYDYHILTTHRGAVTLWNTTEAALDLPGFLVKGCPLDPWTAMEKLVERHGFKNASACLRFLQRVRRKRLMQEERSKIVVAALRAAGMDLPADVPMSGAAEWLSKLPQNR